MNQRANPQCVPSLVAAGRLRAGGALKAASPVMPRPDTNLRMQHKHTHQDLVMHQASTTWV